MTEPRLRVVPIQEGPPISDVVGQLRKLANRIEAGEVKPCYGIMLTVDNENDLDAYGWGHVPSPREIAGLLLEACHMFTNNDVERVD